ASVGSGGVCVHPLGRRSSCLENAPESLDNASLAFGYATAALGQPFTFFCQLDKRAPAGTSPCSRYFHKAIKSFRAKATMPIFRLRPLPPPNRRWYQRD